MANKRRPVSFPELDATPKGKGAILRSAEEIAAEQDMLESQQTSNPESLKTRNSENQKTGDEALLEAPQSGSRNGYPKATYRLSPEALNAIDDAKRELRRRYGVRVTLEEIAEQAILAAYQDLLENKQASMLASTFFSKKESEKTST